jgi:hypothetical protein
MSAVADVVTYLLANAGVSALIDTRMYTDKLDQGETLPAVTAHVISRTHVQHLKGITAAGTIRIQLDVSAETRLAADAVADAIVAALKLLAATPATIGAGTPVCDVEIQGPRHGQEPPADGSDEWTYVSSVDAILNLG